jgi:8-oxo-dGTP pyrophosphatase MutT (NUDIX family)
MRSRILAAGAVLWRDPSRLALAVIHRHRYDDWTLPKGKLDDGETFAGAALREVVEETGHRAEIVGYAGETLYDVGDHPKLVLFFQMVAETSEPCGPLDPDEVAELRWLSVTDALDRLTHEDERAVVRSAVAARGR